MQQNKGEILISGAGIAGLTSAFWLKKYGFDCTIVENAPKLREGGYMIDFWGVGFDVAEKMNIIEELRGRHYHIPELVFVNEKGERVGGFNIDKLRKIINYRHFNMLRSGLAKVLYQNVKDNTEFIFGNSITELEESGNGVRVTFADRSQKEFDLVIGCDGLHSNVRKLVFGPEKEFETHLGYYAASFTIENYLHDPKVFHSLTVPGRSISLYGIGDNKLATLFVYKSDKLNYPHHDIEAQQEILRKEFKDVGWECPSVLKKMPEAEDFYFDDVSQIKMNEWSKGRITLVGDACQCVSLIAGKGSALAMAGAYTLAGELKTASGDYHSAFNKYQETMKKEVEHTQKMGREMAPSFVPETSFGIWKRNLFTKMMFIPFVSKWFIKWFLSDEMELKDY